MKIDYVFIEKFRDIENLKLNLGSKLTFIAGSNSTSKTSLLGLIAQPFSYRERVYNEKLGKETSQIIYRTITNKPFETKFSDIHNLTEYDDIVSIKYKLLLVESEHNVIEMPVAGEHRDKTAKIEKRFVAFPQEREAGKGNYKFPVIYLGLKRLYPLGEHNEKDVHIEECNDITAEYINLYNAIHRELFVDPNINYTLENVNTSNKSLLGGKNENYDSNGFSSGQDNISQIITAILSFKKLKEEVGMEYKGGLLLIDEIESTLHPLVKENLINMLYKFARDYSLQIIITTHSLEVLQIGMQKKYKNDTEIIYLTKTRGSLEFWEKTNFEDIQEDMTAKLLKKETYKQQVLCEDDEAVAFLKAILPKNIKDKIVIISTKLGCGNLMNLATSQISRYNNFLFVLDGDQKTQKNNIICLPGNDSPEGLIHSMLSQMDKDDVFFKKPKPSQQVYLKGFVEIPLKGVNKNQDGVRREKLKEFFSYLKKDVSHQSWNTLFKYWISKNGSEVDKFITRFNLKIEQQKS